MKTLRELREDLEQAHRSGDVAEEMEIALQMSQYCGAAVPGEPTQVANTDEKVRVPPGTIIACAKCHDTEAPAYLLRRVMGRYILLCFRGGDGCWEHSPKPTCEFKDHQGVQCHYPAEATVAFGEDQANPKHVCALHVGACLTPVAGKMTVYPLDI